jgi:hypothetical protein
MADVLDQNVTVNVTVGSAPVTGTNFSVGLYLAEPGSLGGGFTERIRFYTLASEVATDLAATDITQSVADALTDALAQSPRASTFAVGRIDGNDGQTDYVTYGGTTTLVGEIFSLDCDGYTATVTAAGSETPSQIAALMATAIDAALPSDYTVTDSSPIVEITSPDSVPLDTKGSTDSAGVTQVFFNDTATTEIDTDLDAILAENAGFYTMVSEWQGRGMLLKLASWGETNRRVLLGQSDENGLLTGDVNSFAAQNKALNQGYASANYHSVTTEEFCYAWSAMKLEPDPDLRTTTWAYATLSGITADASITTTQLTNLEADYCGFYGLIKGASVAWEGKTGSGLYLDERLSVDWVQDRIETALANLLVKISNRNQKIPYTDAGFRQIASEVERVLEVGITAGHFARIIDDDTGALVSPKVTVPRRAAVTPAQLAARLVPVEFVATLAGAVHKVTVTGYVNVSV